MTRAARPVMYSGVLVVVFGLALIHAQWIGGYSFTGTSRFGWTIAYAGLLSVVAYCFGLPDVPRSRKAALGSAVGASFCGAGAISLVQLFLGDALLPRFVVFGAALLLPDWYRVCVAIAVGGRSRAEARDRVAVVAPHDQVAALMSELKHAPERPAAVVCSLSLEEAVSRHLDELLAADPTVIVLDRRALDSISLVGRVATLHERGVRIRSMSGFYEEWLGKLPVWELKRASLFFDIGELHRTR